MEANRLCAQTPAALGDTYDIMSWCVCMGGGGSVPLVCFQLFYSHCVDKLRCLKTYLQLSIVDNIKTLSAYSTEK